MLFLISVAINVTLKIQSQIQKQTSSVEINIVHLFTQLYLHASLKSEYERVTYDFIFLS